MRAITPLAYAFAIASLIHFGRDSLNYRDRVTTFFIDGLHWSVPAFSTFLAVISILYWHLRQQAIAGVQRNG